MLNAYLGNPGRHNKTVPHGTVFVTSQDTASSSAPMLIVRAAPHPDNMAIAARLAFQPAMPAALTLPQHAPAAHFISTASHNSVTCSSNANRGHYSPFRP